MKGDKVSVNLVGVTIVLAGLVFFADLMVPLGVAAGVPYVALILLGVWYPMRRHVIALAVVSSILIFVGYDFSAPDPVDWQVLANRLMALFVVWLTALLLAFLKSSNVARAKSERSYRKLIDASPVCIHEIDLEGRLVSINPAGLKMMGKTRADEVCGLSYLAFADRSERKKLKRLFDQAVEGQGSVFEFSGDQGQGVQYFSSSFEPVRNEAGQVLKLMGVTQDVTDRVVREQEVRAKTALLETVLEAMSDGICVMDGDLRITGYNTQFCRLLNLPANAFDQWNTFEKFIRLCATRGDYGDGDVDEIVDRFIALAHDPRPREFERQLNGIALHIIARPLPNGGYVTTYTDITGHRAAERKITEAQQQLNDAIEGLDEGFVFFDQDDRLVIANSAFKNMYPSQKDLRPGTSFDEVLRASAYAGEVAEAVGNEEAWIASRKRQHRSDSEVIEQRLSDGRWLKVSNHLTQGGGVVGIRTDITELKESKFLAESANAAKSEFLANMSHELRTPLNSIIGFSEMLKAETFGPVGSDQNRDYIEIIHGSGTHLLKLIGDILDLSKIEAGEETLDEETVHLQEIINECQQMISSRALGKNLSLPLSLADPMPALKADRLKVMQILLNLLSNAVKFTPDGGEVGIDVTVNAAGSVQIRVYDSGDGILAEDLGKVLEPFGQVGNALTRSHDGTGLGLALVKSLTELHGGTVDLSSQLGSGTSVVITFPPERTLAT